MAPVSRLGPRPLVLGMSIVVLLHGAALGKRSELETQRLCRAGVAKNSRLIVSLALDALDACHRRANRGKETGDCNTFADQTEATEANRGPIRADPGIGLGCKPGNPVLQNYPPDSSPLGSMVLGPAFLDTIGASGAELQGTSTGPAPPDQRRARKCRNAIARVRTRIARRVLREATACQKAVDARSTTFGPIDPSCLSKAGGPFGPQMRTLRQRCGSLSGAAVGSCADLPLCVRDFAIATGRALARTTYGGPAVCGNGVIDLSESCDDGNTDDTDACTSACQPASCGDGFVEAGVEACDDGNQFDDDACTSDCTLPVCGDGVVNGNEECDDGNSDPNDGCADCTNSVTCSGVVSAVVQLFDTTSSTMSASNLAGVRLELGYPSGLSIPGNEFETDDSRLSILLTGTAGEGTRLLVDRDTNADGVDDTVRLVYALTGGATFGDEPFASISFDCQAGSAIGLQSFACTVLDASNAVGTDVKTLGRNIVCRVISVQQ